MTATSERPQGLRRRLAALVTALGVAALLVSAVGTGTTEASWTDDENAGLTLTAGTLGPPVANSCSEAGRTFTTRWSSPADPSVVPDRYEYHLVWDPLLGSDVLVADWVDLGTATEFAYTIPASIAAAGSYRFQVRAVAGSWISQPRAGTAPVLSLLGGTISLGDCSWS